MQSQNHLRWKYIYQTQKLPFSLRKIYSLREISEVWYFLNISKNLMGKGKWNYTHTHTPPPPPPHTPLPPPHTTTTTIHYHYHHHTLPLSPPYTTNTTTTTSSSSSSRNWCQYDPRKTKCYASAYIFFTSLKLKLFYNSNCVRYWLYCDHANESTPALNASQTTSSILLLLSPVMSVLTHVSVSCISHLMQTTQNQEYTRWWSLSLACFNFLIANCHVYTCVCVSVSVCLLVLVPVSHD